VDIPNENKLVIQSFISPQDTILSVRINNTNAITGQISKESKIILNASVTISNGIKTILLPYDKDGYYRVPAKLFAIDSGKTYYLKVSVPDGRTATGECTIPSTTVNPQKVFIDIKNTSTDTRLITIKWDDFINEKNYYTVTGTYETLKKGCNTDLPIGIRDKNNDGQQLGIYFSTNVSCGNNNPNFMVIISNYDVNGYEYISTILEQQDINGIPFTEPLQIYSNIKGGYGVFSGYNQLRTIIQVF